MAQPEEVDKVRARVLADCRRAHFSINLEKSSLSRVTYLTHLGIQVDLVSNDFSVPDHKRTSITTAIVDIFQKGSCSARALSTIAGKLSALQVAIGPLTSLFCRAMHKTIASAPTWDGTIRLDDDTLDEFWLAVDWSLFTAPIWPVSAPDPTV